MPPRARAALLIAAVVGITVGATAANVALLDRADEVNAPLGELRQVGLDAPAATAPQTGTSTAPAAPPTTSTPVISVPTRTDDDDDDRHGDDHGGDRGDDDGDDDD